MSYTFVKKLVKNPAVKPVVIVPKIDFLKNHGWFIDEVSLQGRKKLGAK
jgi:hypothetical protein